MSKKYDEYIKFKDEVENINKKDYMLSTNIRYMNEVYKNNKTAENSYLLDIMKKSGILVCLTNGRLGFNGGTGQDIRYNELLLYAIKQIIENKKYVILRESIEYLNRMVEIKKSKVQEEAKEVLNKVS